MPGNQIFHTHTALANGLRELFKQLEERLSLRRPLKVFLAGGMAVHLYTANRVTTDVDAEFGSRVFIPNDLIVDVALEDGTHESVYFDTNYNSSFALLHEDYLDDAIPLDLGGYVGGRAMLLLNLRDAVALARQAEAERHGLETGQGRAAEGPD
jgi:hypothetical protein